MVRYIVNCLLLCGLFLSPVKPKVEEDRAEDVDNDGDDGDDDVEVFEDEEDEEDVEVVEDEEVGEVGEVGRKVEDSSSSFRLVRRLSIGTKLSAALSCIFVEKNSSHVAKDKKDRVLPKTKRSHVAKDEKVISKLWYN